MTPGSIFVDTHDGITTARLTGDVDQAVVDTLTDASLSQFQTEGTVFVDLAGVTFIDSTGLSFLLRLRHVAGTVRLLSEPPTVARLLDLTGTTNLFEHGPAQPV